MGVVTPTGPRFENYAPGQAVGLSSPRISWKFVVVGASQPWAQKAYEVEILHPSQESERHEIEGVSNNLVAWPGEPLASRS